jgi:regulatory protein
MTKILNFLLNLLAKKEYSVKDLRQKALAKKYSEQEFEEALKWLQTKNFQSDIRLAKNLIHSYRSTKGEPWIKQKAYAKGLTAEIWQEAWRSYIQNNEFSDEKIYNQVKNKYNIENFKNLDYSQKSKIYNYLTYRGFKAKDLMQKWQDED